VSGVLASTYRDWRCRCGRLLFRIGPRTIGTIEAKCSRCKAQQVVTITSTSEAL